MTALDFQGEVRLGVPHDVVGPYMPPVLKSFDQACPGVRVSLDCRNSSHLARALERREVDLILTTERGCAPHGETLLPEFAWSGWARATVALTSAIRYWCRLAARTAPSGRSRSRR